MSSAPGKSKELKIITRHVITLDDIVKDEEKLRLLYVIKEFGEISEKAMHYLIHGLQDSKNIDMGYSFNVIGGIPFSKKLREDIVSLLYVGVIETNPRNKKLRITTLGNEVLEKNAEKLGDTNSIKEGIEDLRAKITSIDAELELQALLEKRQRSRRKRTL